MPGEKRDLLCALYSSRKRKTSLLPSVIYDVRIQKRQTQVTQHSTERTGQYIQVGTVHGHTRRGTWEAGITGGGGHGAGLQESHRDSERRKYTKSRCFSQRWSEDAGPVTREGWGVRNCHTGGKGVACQAQKSWFCALFKCLFQSTHVYGKPTW